MYLVYNAHATLAAENAGIKTIYDWIRVSTIIVKFSVCGDNHSKLTHINYKWIDGSKMIWYMKI